MASKYALLRSETSFTLRFFSRIDIASHAILRSKHVQLFFFNSCVCLSFLKDVDALDENHVQFVLFLFVKFFPQFDVYESR